jgi:hypothetical protein
MASRRGQPLRPGLHQLDGLPGDTRGVPDRERGRLRRLPREDRPAARRGQSRRRRGRGRLVKSVARDHELRRDGPSDQRPGDVALGRRQTELLEVATNPSLPARGRETAPGGAGRALWARRRSGRRTARDKRVRLPQRRRRRDPFSRDARYGRRQRLVTTARTRSPRGSGHGDRVREASASEEKGRFRRPAIAYRAAPAFVGGCRETTGEHAGSPLRVGSENGHLVRRTQAVRCEDVLHGGSEAPSASVLRVSSNGFIRQPHAEAAAGEVARRSASVRVSRLSDSPRQCTSDDLDDDPSPQTVERLRELYGPADRPRQCRGSSDVPGE